MNKTVTPSSQQVARYDTGLCGNLRRLRHLGPILCQPMKFCKGWTKRSPLVASACPEGLQTPILSWASRSLLRQVFLHLCTQNCASLYCCNMICDCSLHFRNPNHKPDSKSHIVLILLQFSLATSSSVLFSWDVNYITKSPEFNFPLHENPTWLFQGLLHIRRLGVARVKQFLGIPCEIVLPS